MWISGQLLMWCDVLGVPSKEKREAKVNESNEDRRIQNRLPHGCRAE